MTLSLYYRTFRHIGVIYAPEAGEFILKEPHNILDESWQPYLPQGALAEKLTHPSYEKKKIYHVTCDKNVAMSDMDLLVNGIELEDGHVYADEVTYVNEADRSQIGIEIHSGKNRIVRRMLEHLGYRVNKLDRVLFAGLTKKNLRRGDWRYLTDKEVNMLRMGAYE